MQPEASQPSLETIGRNIRRWREHREMKCEDFAAKIGLCKASLSKIENGQTDLSIKRIFAIAMALGLTTKQLCYIDPQTIVTQWLRVNNAPKHIDDPCENR